jgi:hypothetical protein
MSRISLATLLVRCPDSTGKDTLIAHLCAAPIEWPLREALYRAWCGAVGTTVWQSDLARLKARRAAEAQRSLTFIGGNS